MIHTTKHGNKYTAQEWLEMQDHFTDESDENDEWLQVQEELLERAAGFLNREFADVPIATWKSALYRPHLAQFTDSKKAARFNAAQEWIESELSKI